MIDRYFIESNSAGLPQEVHHAELYRIKEGAAPLLRIRLRQGYDEHGEPELLSDEGEPLSAEEIEKYLNPPSSVLIDELIVHHPRTDRYGLPYPSTACIPALINALDPLPDPSLWRFHENSHVGFKDTGDDSAETKSFLVLHYAPRDVEHIWGSDILARRTREMTRTITEEEEIMRNVSLFQESLGRFITERCRADFLEWSRKFLNINEILEAYVAYRDE